MAYFEIKNLSIKFKNKFILNNINIKILKGEILGLVGESGSGKTMISRAIFHLLPPSMEICSGHIFLEGINILNTKNNIDRNIFGNDIALIPQNTVSSLNPIIKIGKQMEEGIWIHDIKNKKVNKVKNKEIVMQSLKEVGLSESVYNLYPYELSGGMIQRVLIAISIINNPKVIIADEPTTALDAVVQLEILKLLKELVKKRNISLIFISHDLEVINYLCHNVFVLYGGHLMEYG